MVSIFKIEVSTQKASFFKYSEFVNLRMANGIIKKFNYFLFLQILNKKKVKYRFRTISQRITPLGGFRFQIC